MSLGHGKKKLLKDLPRSQFYEGPFGRLFRNLPPFEPEGNTDEERTDNLLAMGQEMIESEAEAIDASRDNGGIPAGYTYFGQFVDHDITFDPTSSLQRFSDPDKLKNFRTPRLDLDNLYGGGPADTPFMYDRDTQNQHLLIGTAVDKHEPDLPRNLQDVALIGDMRNDENTFVSQLQLGFINFHNRMVDRTGDFEEAQRLVRWHYQYVVVNDYLKRLCGNQLIKDILPKPGSDRFRLKHYKWKRQPYMPVEFSVAAYRLGHSMVRSNYSLNFLVGPLPIFDPAGDFDPKKETDPRADFRGFRRLPDKWTLQWDMFLDIESSNPQLSRKLDLKLSRGLAQLVGETDPVNKNLAARNLIRGWRMGLPSGQRVAKAMRLKPLKGPEEPLWHYILREADEQEKGSQLGEVGARIVAEVFLGLLSGDSNSYLNIEPDWQPENADGGSGFELRDILKLAEVPLSQADLQAKPNF